MANDKNTAVPEGRKKGFSRIIFVISFALSLIPLVAYLLLLPALPDNLPVKYDDMGLKFPFADIPAAKKEDVLALEELLK